MEIYRTTLDQQSFDSLQQLLSTDEPEVLEPKTFGEFDKVVKNCMATLWLLSPELQSNAAKYYFEYFFHHHTPHTLATLFKGKYNLRTREKPMVMKVTANPETRESVFSLENADYSSLLNKTLADIRHRIEICS